VSYRGKVKNGDNNHKARESIKASDFFEHNPPPWRKADPSEPALNWAFISTGGHATRRGAN
jgi:hypothetical protein